MSQVLSLEAEIRENAGKGVARALRREGKLPGIVYGHNKKDIRIATDFNTFSKLYLKGHFSSHIVNLNVDGKVIKVLPRDVQIHPVTDVPLHVDFQILEAGKKVRVAVQVVICNAERSPGVKRGGVINIIRRDIELLCDPDNIPTKLEIDLTGKNVGDSVHISSISLPEGCTPTITDRDFTVATLTGRGKTEEEETAAAAAEPEEEEASAE
jgi:large subunit ribosomal protein L25